MADDKPKDDAFVKAARDYIDALNALKALPQGKDPEFDAVIKALAERGKHVTPAQMAALLVLFDPTAAAQRLAEETNQVDEALTSEWFKEHWKDRNCPICHQVSWAMASVFAHIPLARIQMGPSESVRTVPCVVLSCRICGNTVFFNARAMKLMPPGAGTE